MGTVTVAYRGESAARSILATSLAELRRLLGESHPDVQQATRDMLMVTGDSVEARALLDRLMAMERESPSRDPTALAEQIHTRATQRLAEGHPGEAAALFQATLDILAQSRPPTDDDVRTVRRNLAVALVHGGQLARAESLQRAELALEERIHGAADTRAAAREALAITFVAEGRGDSAEIHEREALRLFRAGVAPTHWRIWSALRNLAVIVSNRGRPAEGLALIDSAIALAALGTDSVEQGGYLVAQRAALLLELGRVEEAAAAVASAERTLGTSASVTAPHRADVDRYAGVVLLAQGDAARAVERFRAAVALAEPPGRPETPPALNSCLLGIALARLGRATEARPLLDAACRRYESSGLLDPLLVEWIREARRTIGGRVGGAAPSHDSSLRTTPRVG
jgi:tetratricopeptide (TPR) repeat protein